MATAGGTSKSFTMSLFITGESVVKIFRDLVLDGRWQFALDGLVKDFEGMTYDLAIAILSGKQSLTGKSPDIFLCGQDPKKCKKYLQDMNFLYGSVMEFQGKFYKPYAWVASYGANDFFYSIKYHSVYGDLHYEEMIEAEEQKDHLPSHRPKQRRRGLFYADNPGGDLCEWVTYGEDKRQILFEQVNGVPIWYTPAKSFQESVDRCREYKILLSRRGGMDEIIPDQETPTVFPPQAAKKKRPPVKYIPLNQREPSSDYEPLLREKIIEQAGKTGGFILIKSQGKLYRVPKAPFELWSVGRYGGSHLVTPWKTVSPPRMKMGFDDPVHTDWWLGAGLTIDDYQDKDREFHSPFYNKSFELQRELKSFSCQVLSGYGSVEGVVIHPEPGYLVKERVIAVIPFATPDYYDLMVKVTELGGGVITEEGGPSCHLASMGRELNARIVRVENARTMYPERSKVSINCTTGRVDFLRKE